MDQRRKVGETAGAPRAIRSLPFADSADTRLFANDYVLPGSNPLVRGWGGYVCVCVCVRACRVRVAGRGKAGEGEGRPADTACICSFLAVVQRMQLCLMRCMQAHVARTGMVLYACVHVHEFVRGHACCAGHGA
jgi:hypothetical protein